MPLARRAEIFYDEVTEEWILSVTDENEDELHTGSFDDVEELADAVSETMR